MKLTMFNSWNNIGNFYGVKAEYQTFKPKNSSLYYTYIRSAVDNVIFIKAYAKDANTSLQRAVDLLKKSGEQKIKNAIYTGRAIVNSGDSPIQNNYNNVSPGNLKTKIDWRDGSNHRYRAQRKIVGESAKKPFVTPIRNLVAKHSKGLYKSGAMKDKKNQYSRKQKHKRKYSRED